MLDSGIRRFLPCLHWLPELRDYRVLRADALAGLTVALVLIPQSMAYAQLAGLPAQHGLYAAFLPGMMAALFGSSRQLATGPVAIVSLMSAASIAELAPPSTEAFIAYSLTLALLIGGLQIALGALRLGVLINLLSHPVVLGFTNAAALIIASSQLGKLFGVTVSTADYHYETVWRTLNAIAGGMHGPTVAMGTAALAGMLLVGRIVPRLPVVLIAALTTLLASHWLNFEALGGAVVGQVPSGLPSPSLPPLQFELLLDLLSPALTIALIGFIEAISIAKATAAQQGQRLDASQELIGQGLANTTAALSGGYAVSGSFSRTALNHASGARTGFSGVITGLIVGVTLIWLTPQLYHLPQATLAAIIVFAVLKLIHLRPFIEAWRLQPHDALVGIATFAITLITAPQLETGLLGGVLLSGALYLYRGLRPETALLSRHPDGRLRHASKHGLATCDEIAVLSFSAPLYFASAGFFETQVLDLLRARPQLRFIIVGIRGVHEIDSTGREVLLGLKRELSAEGIQLLFVGARAHLRDNLRRSGLQDSLGKERFFRRYDDALEHAWSQLPAHHREQCPLHHPCAKADAVATSR